MKNHKTTIFGIGLFILKNNYLIFTYFFIPLLMREYQNITYLMPLIFIPIALILVLVLPKKIGVINYEEIINRSFFAKFSYYTTQFISFILNVLICSYTVQRMFLYESHIVIFIVAVLLVTIYISSTKEEVIFNSASMLFIVAIVLVIIPIFIAIDVKDFTLVKPLYEFKGIAFLWIIYFILDSISIILTKVETPKIMTKTKLVIPILIMLIFMSLDLLNIIVITGDSYLLDNEFLGFFTLFIQDTINYIGNLGLFFLFIIPIIGTFKAGFSLRRIKNGFNINNSILSNSLIFIVTAVLVFVIVSLLDVWIFSYYMILISIILLSVVYLFIILNRSPNYEIRF